MRHPRLQHQKKNPPITEMIGVDTWHIITLGVHSNGRRQVGHSCVYLLAHLEKEFGSQRQANP